MAHRGDGGICLKLPGYATLQGRHMGPGPFPEELSVLLKGITKMDLL